MPRTFIPKDKYPNHSKAKLKDMFNDFSYSGRTYQDKDGNVLRPVGFYTSGIK